LAAFGAFTKHYRSFENQVLPELVSQGIGVLGMKSMGSGVILKSKTVTPIECLHYSLNLPTSVVITGIDSLKILKQAFEVAKNSAPPFEALRGETQSQVGTGRVGRRIRVVQNNFDF